MFEINLRQVPFALGVVLCAVSAPVVAAAAPVDDSTMSSTFSITEKTVVPSATLPPGDYTIKVVDHLADRMIVRIEGTSSNVRSTFIGLTDPKLAKTSKPGVITFNAGLKGSAALRGYDFPDGNTLQFVYPKADAVTLAKANSTRVVAIDPASEGRPTDKNLSQGDMEVVTLWTLTAQPVGPAEKADKSGGIKAERYEVAASVAPPKPGIAQLPHTASMMPAGFLLMLFSICAAMVLRWRRVRPASASTNRGW